MLASLGSRVVQEVVPQYRAADALAGLQTRPQRKGAHVGRHHRFETAAGTKLHGRALIHCHQNGLFPVFVKELGVGSTRARRDAPVDRANVVSGCIGAYLVKFDASASLARAAHAREVGERTAALLRDRRLLKALRHAAEHVRKGKGSKRDAVWWTSRTLVEGAASDLHRSDDDGGADVSQSAHSTGVTDNSTNSTTQISFITYSSFKRDLPVDGTWRLERNDSTVAIDGGSFRFRPHWRATQVHADLVGSVTAPALLAQGAWKLVLEDEWGYYSRSLIVRCDAANTTSDW